MSPSSGVARAAAALLLALLPWAAAPSATTAAQPQAVVSCNSDRAVFLTGDGQAVSLSVEVADTPQARARGLMWRRSLEPGTGMLFIYERPQPVSFWMRNTLIPLDLIFMDALGVIRHIHAGAVPLDETPIPGAVEGDPDPARLMVLEVGGGEAARLGLAVGQAMAHPALPQATARLACR